MIPLESAVVNQVYTLQELEQKLKPLGFDIGSNWEYDHGYFDYAFAKKGEYVFLRIPFTAEIGQLDEPGVQVRIGQPFMLGHQYEDNEDVDGILSNSTALINQFQTPVDSDAEIAPEYKDKGEHFMKTVEKVLLS
ncbi:YugN family protein [Salirhabdus salicampi]|uniref:YugN family protein n=1 Tax=Salirhabdus salicampi TaxID=476102 RepID=UPI0020C3E6F4|nr:YugN family protein [Salirhabdus salicampi]MCP8617781.1 YugN-like family protein [Salirhabdus salicampi]